MKRVYVGLDLGSSQFEYVAMDREGVVLARHIFKTSEENLRAAFGLLRAEQSGELHVHLEASELAGWAREVIASQVTRVLIGDPRRSAWIANDPCKSDRLDAFKLADLLRMNRVHKVYYADTQPRRIFKQVVQHYEDLTRRQACSESASLLVSSRRCQSQKSLSAAGEGKFTLDIGFHTCGLTDILQLVFSCPKWAQGRKRNAKVLTRTACPDRIILFWLSS